MKIKTIIEQVDFQFNWLEILTFLMKILKKNLLKEMKLLKKLANVELDKIANEVPVDERLFALSSNMTQNMIKL